MVKPYGFKNEIVGMKNTYESTIPDILVPIENPIGHLPGVQFGAAIWGCETDLSVSIR